jgi:hypothetical protein
MARSWQHWFSTEIPFIRGQTSGGGRPILPGLRSGVLRMPASEFPIWSSQFIGEKSILVCKKISYDISRFLKVTHLKVFLRSKFQRYRCFKKGNIYKK